MHRIVKSIPPELKDLEMGGEAEPCIQVNVCPYGLPWPHVEHGELWGEGCFRLLRSER